MKHPKYAAIHAAMQKLIPTMCRRAQQKPHKPYRKVLAQEWILYLKSA